MVAIIFHVSRDSRRVRSISSESVGLSFSLHDTGALPFGMSWQLQSNKAITVKVRQGSFSSLALLYNGQGSHLTTVHKSFSGTDIAFAWRSCMYRWVVMHSGLNTSRIQMRLLEDSTELEVARMEGVAAGGLCNPSRHHEIQSIIVMDGRRHPKESTWVQVVITSGLIAAKQQRKQIAAINSRPSSPRAIAPRYV